METKSKNNHCLNLPRDAKSNYKGLKHLLHVTFFPTQSQKYTSLKIKVIHLVFVCFTTPTLLSLNPLVHLMSTRMKDHPIITLQNFQIQQHMNEQEIKETNLLGTHKILNHWPNNFPHIQQP
jgi:hypothetical protein